MKQSPAQQLFQAAKFLSDAGKYTAEQTPAELFFIQLHQQLQAQISTEIARLGHTDTRGHRRAAHLILLRDRLEQQLIDAFADERGFNMDTSFRGLMAVFQSEIKNAQPGSGTHSERVQPIFTRLREHSLSSYQNYLSTKKTYIAQYEGEAEDKVYCSFKDGQSPKNIHITRDSLISTDSNPLADQKNSAPGIHQQLEESFQGKIFIGNFADKVKYLCDMVLKDEYLGKQGKLTKKYAKENGNLRKRAILETLLTTVEQISNDISKEEEKITEKDACESYYPRLKDALQTAIEANKQASGLWSISTEFKDALEGGSKLDEKTQETITKPGLLTSVQTEWNRCSQASEHFKGLAEHRETLKNSQGVYRHTRQFMHEIARATTPKTTAASSTSIVAEPSASSGDDSNNKSTPPPFDDSKDAKTNPEVPASVPSATTSIHQLSFRLLKVPPLADPEKKSNTDVIDSSSQEMSVNFSTVPDGSKGALITKLQTTMDEYKCYLNEQFFVGKNRYKQPLVDRFERQLNAIQDEKSLKNPEEVFSAAMNAIDDLDRDNKRLSGTQLTRTIASLRRQAYDSVLPDNCQLTRAGSGEYELIQNLEKILREYELRFEGQTFQNSQKKDLIDGLNVKFLTIKVNINGIAKPPDTEVVSQLLDAIETAERDNASLKGTEFRRTLANMRETVHQAISPQRSQLISVSKKAAHTRAVTDPHRIHVIKVKKQWFKDHRERFFYKDPKLNKVRMTGVPQLPSFLLGITSIVSGAFVSALGFGMAIGVGEVAQPIIATGVGLMAIGVGTVGAKDSPLRVYPGEFGNLLKEIPHKGENNFTYVSSVDQLDDNKCKPDEMFLFVPDPRDQETIKREGFAKVTSGTQGWPVFTTASSAADFLNVKARQGAESYTERGWHQREGYAQDALAQSKGQVPSLFFSLPEEKVPSSTTTTTSGLITGPPPSYNPSST